LTLDGGCSGITLTAAPDISILMVGSRDSNLIVARLQFEKHDPTPPNSSGDCISVGQDADRVWIAWNSLRNCGDGAVDITQSRASNTPTRVTVAFNRFAQHDKVMLNATLECFRPERTPDCVAPLERGWNWSRGVQVTLQGNVFLGTGQRHPRMAGLAYTHMLDNVVAFRPFLRTSGESSASYGSFVGAGARGLFENNLYLPLGAHSRHRAITSNGDLGVAPSRFDGGGAVRAVGNVALRQASVEERHPELVPLPPYQLSPRRHFSNPERGARCALALSGPWAPLRTPPPECQE
jgi:pectate lyase